MPHIHDVAHLWAELVKKKDHAYLIREILGRLWPKSFRDPQVIDEAYVKDIVLLKTIFDIQRTRIRLNPPSRRILSTDDLLDCLNCLSRAAEALRQVDNRLRRTFMDISQQAFFSGFRTAALTIERLPEETLARVEVSSRLRTCIGRWPLEDLPGPVRDWSSAIFEGAVEDLLSLDESDSSCDEHISLDRPDRENFAQTFRLSKCVPQAIACIARGCKYAYRSALVLLDFRLMVIAACFRHVSNGSNSGVLPDPSESSRGYSNSSLLTDEFNRLLENWRALGNYLQKANGERPLSTFLYFVDDIEPGPPFGENDHILNWIGPIISVPASSANTGTSSPLYAKIVEDLRLRNLAVFDSQGALLDVHGRLSEQIRSWLPPRANTPGPHSLDSPDITPQQTIYVLDCSDVHPIDYTMLVDCVDPSGQEALEIGQEIIDVYFWCPFPHSKASLVRKARRVTPICEIYGTLQRLVSFHAETGDPVAERENTLAEHAQLSESSAGSREASSSDQVSMTSTFTQSLGPQSPSTASVRQPSSLRGFLKASSWRSSTKPKIPVHKHTKSDSAQQSLYLRSALSPDAANLIVWSRNRIRCWSLNSGIRCRQERFLENILLAAAGATHFAAIIQKHNKCFQLSLFDAAGAPAEKLMPFDKCPKSMAFSHDGSKLAVATPDELRIISTTIEDWAGSYCSQSLIPQLNRQDAGPRDTQKTQSAFCRTYGVRRQTISFSPDRHQVLVGTQYLDDEGTIMLWLFDIPERVTGALSRTFLFAREIKVESSDTGLTALPCFHSSGQTTFILCAATAHSHRSKVESIIPSPTRGEAPQAVLEEIAGPKLSIDRAHRGIAMPGQTPSFVIVNEEADVYLVRGFSSRSGWEAKHVPLCLNLRPFNQGGRRPEIEIAASSASEVIIFHIWQNLGHLTRYDALNPQQSTSQPIPLDDFFPRPTDISTSRTN
ncbi:uncharacterized protein Z519_06580 [Cladophialophora bantiana CBS 173.52]|uniref:Uncharacterized protein n=1 Tax=Cladophialophora bantiana (strain ATCC 10958 / CBS 173.52 / CDC B-1940 / NIH 8579) TaxID=1442370 RepID=A0A0D2G1W8_CLAB1|nr:uncharacterized protein Z519_06580 [Cladophialophora bantiana CBS 173.52]KIW92732.1 hypothetical protein Z519_06580 [Cladophialophora bantiana CBS 173.52]